MSKKAVPSKSKLRFQISISPAVARLWSQLAKAERRNRSNTLEVLIEREAIRANKTKAAA